MIKSLLMPSAARIMTSQRLRRLRQMPDKLKLRWKGEKPTLRFFHQLDDPYSYLALEITSHLLNRYDIAVEVHVVNDEYEGIVPIEHWVRYRIHDARRLAKVWSMSEFVSVDTPDAEQLKACMSVLPSVPRSAYANVVLQLSRALWNGRPNQVQEYVSQYNAVDEYAVKRHVSKGRDLREELGHYQAGMWHFAGDWFWGLDRLELLEDKLDYWGLAKQAQTISSELYVPRLIPPLNGEILDVFFSFRSPYSYLALSRIFEVKKHNRQKIQMRLRPVLPMVKRGVKLSDHKREYILQDAARLSKKYQIPFGYIQDPLGPGIDKCVSLFYFAREKNLAQRFVHTVMKGIWSEGANVNSNRTLARLCERCGLDWQQAKLHLADPDASVAVKKNQEQLELMGLWGVPTFTLTDNNNRLQSVYWGQDRIAWLQYGLSAR